MKSKFMNIEVFIAEDGREFYDEDECLQYEKENCYNSKLEKSKFYCYGSLKLSDVKDVEEFLLENKDWVLELMNWKDNSWSI